MNFSSWFFNITEGIVIAFDAIRQNKVRAALTILGVAVGVFVVVTLSAAVHGINASVAKDLESAGPTSFYMYRRPISLATICDGTDETCPWRRNPPITLTEADRISRLPEILPSTVLDRLVASGGAMVVYLHIGPSGDETPERLSAGMKALDEVARRVREGTLGVFRTVDLLERAAETYSPK